MPGNLQARCKPANGREGVKMGEQAEAHGCVRCIGGVPATAAGPILRQGAAR